MSVLFYNIFLLFYNVAIRIFSLFHPKAAKWVKGRKNIFPKLSGEINVNDQVIWMHCASLGEFEQGRPILELIRTAFPKYKVLLTFFSPSGYEAQKNFTGANWIFYLPMDGPRNAKKFLEIVRPTLVIFVKYEFWYYYLKKIRYRNIPLLLVSASFRRNMSFFKWWGAIQRKMLSRFHHLFVQNQQSMDLLSEIGFGSICSVSGDTRFDRVIKIMEQKKNVPLIEDFIGEHRAIVAGSTWPEDESVLHKTFLSLQDKHLKWIIAPHEISDSRIQMLLKLFPGALIYSKLTSGIQHSASSILIIDQIGHLSKLYRYAYITYVGGGLSKTGVHNVLEAAVYSKPVLFGNNYQQYSEAVELVEIGGGLPFTDEKKNGQMLGELVRGLLQNIKEYDNCCRVAGEFVRSNSGATRKIIAFIQENRLLTN